ncbi:MAG: hypothetical protein RXO36_03880 [Candidatus Nanopusillus acidilobi]
MVKVSTKQLKDAVRKSLTSKDQEVIMLRAMNGTLEVCSATRDSYLAINVPTYLQDSNFVAVVDKKSLSKILRSIKTKYVELSIEKDYLIINNDNALRTRYPELFQTYWLDKNIDNGIVLNSQTIVNAIDKVLYFLSKEKYDIIFSFENNTLYVVGMTIYYMAFYNLKVPNNLSIMIGFSETAVSYLKKILNSNKNVLFNIIDDYRQGFKYDRIAVFKTDDFIFTTGVTKIEDLKNIQNLINAYRKNLINTRRKDLITDPIELKLLKKDMIYALKSLIVEDRNFNPIRLTIANNCLNLLSLLDNTEIDIPVEYTGDEITTDFDAVYLLKAIENISGDLVVLRFPSDRKGIWYHWFIEPDSKYSNNYVSIFRSLRFRMRQNKNAIVNANNLI